MNNLENIAQRYDSLHEDWKSLEEAVREKEFSNLVSFCSSSHQSVIEFGLGDGVFTSMLCERFSTVKAIDAAETTIDLLKSRLHHDNLSFEQSYVENYTTETTYDVIVMSHILEHLDDPIGALKNVKKLMHQDSLLYISVPNANSLHRLVAVKMGLLERPDSLNQRDVELGHKIVYFPSDFRGVVESAELNIVSFGGVMIKPLANSQISKDWSSNMVDGFIALGDDLPELCGDIYVVAKR